MKSLVLFLAVSMAWVGTIAQSARDFARQGNQAYQAGEYEKAAALYHKADSLDPNFFESAFNKGDAHYQQGNFDEAIKEFNEVAQASDNTKLKAQALHNLGNAFLEKKEYDKSVEAFKNALRTDPTDEDTRYNLSYAMKKLQQQQKKEQEKQDQDKDKDQKEDEKDDKQQEKDQKEDQKKKDNQDQNKDDKNKEDQQKDNEKKNKDEQKKDENKKGEDNQQPAQPKEGELSKKDAQRMLKANENQEKKTQEKMRKKLLKGEPKKIEKNW